MPGFDKTGPMGQGPMTGGGRGSCKGGRAMGRGSGCGCKMGRGSGCGCKMGRGAGFCRRASEDEARSKLMARKQALEEELREVEKLLGQV